MKLTIPLLKARFASLDKPGAKDFSDLIDTFLAYVVTDDHINTLIGAAITDLASSSGAKVIAQAAVPAYTSSDSGTAIWLQTLDNSGNTITRPYWIKNDAPSGSPVYNWHSKHPLSPGTIILVTDLAKLGIPGIDNTSNYATFTNALLTYDGGGTPGNGAMWEVVSELTGRFPVSVDTGNTALQFNMTGGEATHQLTAGELPAHNHVNADGPFSYLLKVPYVGSTTGSGTVHSGSQQAVGAGDGGQIATVGNNQAHNNMPPYRTAYFLRRTSRTDYVVAAP